MKPIFRTATLIAVLAKMTYWIDRLWQQLQRHQVFAVMGAEAF
jgi:hypothetical protein